MLPTATRVKNSATAATRAILHDRTTIISDTPRRRRRRAGDLGGPRWTKAAQVEGWWKIASSEAGDRIARVDRFVVQHCLGGDLGDGWSQGVAVRGDGVEEPGEGLAQQGGAVDRGIDPGPGAQDGQRR